VLINHSTFNRNKTTTDIKKQQSNKMSIAKSNPHYQKIFITFMSFTNGLDYDNNHAFSLEELGAITPAIIRRWMCYKAYGKAEVEPGDLPRLCRSASLEMFKKSISWYMPNRIATWDCLTMKGNPSKSVEVNDLIKMVLRHECRQQGAMSRVKRAMTRQEFVKAIAIFNAKDAFQQSTRVTTMMILRILR
jgi:hypothetical protein